ncbi:MAG: hypothetical protein ACJAYN_000756, partial [Bermanella sp.]
MTQTKNVELLLRITELSSQLEDAHKAYKCVALQAETVANIAKNKEEELQAQIIVLETTLDRTRKINRDQLKNDKSNYAELMATVEELDVANIDKGIWAAQLVIAKEQLVSENQDKDARLAALDIANKEKDQRAAELVIANKDKDARAAELVIAKEKLVSENQEKDARLAALDIANKE